MTEPRIIELTEYEPLYLPAKDLTREEGHAIWTSQSNRISIDTPSFKTDNAWCLTSHGWVGYIPVHPELGLSIRPRVSLSNLFEMLEYAYNLKSFELFDGLVGCASLQEFYGRLARILARRVLDRARRGLYRTYLGWDERLMCVRGRINMRRAVARPWDPALRCEYEEHTSDIEENQILVYTLATIARSGLCGGETSPTVRRAHRAIRGFASNKSVTADQCLGRIYNRLNDDYRPMHALCRFFLEHAGPTLGFGEHQMIPFVVNMPQLFELFVAEWLRTHVTDPYEVKAQYSLNLGGDEQFKIRVDLLIRERKTGRVIAVMDTKYKRPEKPSNIDINAVVTYALANNCTEGVLIYPTCLQHHVDLRIKDVHVRSLHFDLGDDLEQSGMLLMWEMFDGMPESALGD